MNLEDKVNRILPAIRFISEHDDATEGMVRAALGEVAHHGAGHDALDPHLPDHY